MVISYSCPTHASCAADSKSKGKAKNAVVVYKNLSIDTFTTIGLISLLEEEVRPLFSFMNYSVRPLCVGARLVYPCFLENKNVLGRNDVDDSVAPETQCCNFRHDFGLAHLVKRCDPRTKILCLVLDD